MSQVTSVTDKQTDRRRDKQNCRNVLYTALCDERRAYNNRADDVSVIYTEDDAQIFMDMI